MYLLSIYTYNCHCLRLIARDSCLLITCITLSRLWAVIQVLTVFDDQGYYGTLLLLQNT